ncbi:hydrolase, NUDIX family protein [Trichomonas vaginalis G3]|uniref:Hydrolase, NUDIX family protein n=1 Tax=Trichomonas vaginalis (strain ATCC PRA-98 / G3) TaxID=412133 RepID=A2G329_TRIV3|nr:8-hydroxy-dADP phosphatase protein [Trichomonas vaginalis G3]EAX88440.1 hydrolase, NUDIX family protein [Trichomonas vaginalis G3]KAI5535274.1 8-hydroxy-dADP phosphatase protein [Trichomonas vaginalis G3]|eukprot:XP_001301370.1 hydrolase, NUDIX family protein [Trichomonas vaginalis G3]
MDRRAHPGVKNEKYSSFYKVRFGDIKIKWEGEIRDSFSLINFVNEHIDEWKKDDRPSIWIKLHGKDLDHINVLLNAGFKIHRTKPNNVLVLNKWIREYSNTLPLPPFAYLGVGAMCINKEGKILAVRENYKTGPSIWKLPGGLYDPSKDHKLSDTAVRECFEETSIKAEPEYLVNSRFIHKGGTFSAPDLYTVFRLRPLTEEIKFDPVEIYEAAWVNPQVLIDAGYNQIVWAVQSQMKNQEGLVEIPTRFRNSDHIVYTRKPEDSN